MQRLDLTLDSAAANVALDEALVEEAEGAGEPRELLRLWEPEHPMVVIGRSSRAEEVQLDFCRERRIPVLRRTSGGAAIVSGPGCLMYAVMLSYELRPELRGVDATHRFVLETVAGALAKCVPGVRRQGTSDLVVGNRKFSGNSVRCKRQHVLYHGTLLYDFPLDLIGDCLGVAPRQPVYRAGREHRAFVANLPLSADELRTVLAEAWRAQAVTTEWPAERVERLLSEKYTQPEWNLCM
jgi:lipoate-protein ligase A